MLNQKELLNPELTKKLLSFSESIEELLFMINNNFDSIYIVFNKGKSYINIEQLKKQDVSDNLIMLQKDIELLIKKQEKVEYKLIIFDQNFWSFYLNNKRGFKSLRLIEQIIIKYKRIDNNINLEEISKMIHETEIKMIKSGKLKNEKLLDFFFNNYIKFNENNNNIYFPIFYVDGIDLDLANSTFFKKWDELNIISYINYDHYLFCQKIINKLNKIEHLNKTFKSPQKRKEILINKNNIVLLMDKISQLIITYEFNNDRNFNKDLSRLIYYIDKSGQNSTNFLNNIIFKKIKSMETKIDFCLNILSNYRDITADLMRFLIIVLIRNKNMLNNKSLELLKSYLNYDSVIISIFNELNDIIIKEEEFFNEEKNIDFFQLFEIVQELIDCGVFIETNYFTNINKLRNNILLKLKSGNIKYNTIYSWLNDDEKKKLFKKRLSILLFNNVNEVNNCINSLEKYFEKINNIITYTQKLSNVLKQYFLDEYKNDIEYLDNMEEYLKNRLLNEVDKINTKIDKNKYIKDLDLDEMIQLKTSIIFIDLFNNVKKGNYNINGIEVFKNAKNKFNQLKILFNDDWQENPIINEYSGIFKKLNEDELEKELIYMKEYFGINDLNDLYILNLKKDLTLLFIKKEEALLDISNCFSFISKFVPKQTDTFLTLNNLKKDISNYINLKELQNYNKYREKLITNLCKENNDKNLFNSTSKVSTSRINQLTNNNSNKNESFQLMIQLKERDEQLKEINEQLHFEFKRGEKLMTINFSSINQKIHSSYICKNTDIFSRLEALLYKDYPEYQEEENFFTVNGIKIIKSKSLEENKIKNNDIIILNKIEFELF